MKPLNLENQNGLALLIFVVMLMGIGGFVLIGYGQGLLKNIGAKKFEHNTRVLKEAKQALLQYAYNYPQFNSEGPGRLPCPAPDNTGLTGALTLALCQSVNRLPWAESEMSFYDARDADGEQLWYAVSENFYNLGGGAIINSDSEGTITLVDQSENIIYDGNGAGIAAIIIAPGPEMAGQDRNADPDDPANFLDSFNGFDNAVFTNGESDTNDDGFILGPVFDPAQNFNVINDQLIVITVTEVIEVAEKAVLQAYRTAISDYLTNTGNVYPWLYNYAGVPDVPGLSSYYPAVSTAGAADFATELATNLDNFGRIPSIFDEYFTDSDSEPIESRLSVSLSMTYPVTPTPVGSSSSGNQLFNDAAVHALNIQTVDKLTNVKFDDIAGPDGQLTGTVITDELFTHEIYFWDEDNDPLPTTGIWTLCPAGADDPSDCDRDSAGNPDPGAGNQTNAELLRVVLELDFDTAVNGGVVNFEMDYTTSPTIGPPAAADNTSHALITATFDGADIIVNSLPLSARYEIDRHYHTNFDIEESGTLDLGDLVPGPLALSMRFYPELPDWAFDNGWHDSVMMAYAFDHRPDETAPCAEGTDCIQINSLAGNMDNKISILTIAGQHNWDDDTDSDFINDLPTIFDTENADILDIDGTEYLFDKRELGGNDKILVIDEI